MTDLYWASASESLCHEADRISAPELVGDEEVFFKSIYWFWKARYLPPENNLNHSIVYSGNYLSLNCSFRKLSQAESLTNACFSWNVIATHSGSHAEAAVVNQSRRNLAHCNKQCTLFSQEDNTNSLALLSIQKSKNALHGDFLKSYFTSKLTRPDFKL